MTKHIFVGIVQKNPTMKYTLLMLCLSFTFSGNAQSFSDFESYTPQIVIPLGNPPIVKDGNMTIYYNFINCDSAFKRPFNLVVQVCDSGMFQPCTIYTKPCTVDSIFRKQIIWTLHKVPMTLCGTLLVRASIETLQGKILLTSDKTKVFMTCYLPKKDSAQKIDQ